MSHPAAAAFVRSLLALCAVTACAGPGSGSPGDDAAVRSADGSASATQPIVRDLADGTLVAIEPVAIVGADDTRTAVDRRVLGGWLREGLRVSATLDFAAAPEAPRRPMIRIATTYDRDAGSLSTSLAFEADSATRANVANATVPLVTVSTQDRPLLAATEELVWRTRAALGDPAPGPADPFAQLAQIYTADPRGVAWTEHAYEDVSLGRLASARALLERARRLDAGNTIALALLTSVTLDSGDAEAAARLANDTLRHLDARLAPTTRLRLARTMLLAQASLAGGRVRDARDVDAKLLALGETFERERPYDPHARYTRALALNYLGRFDESLPPLRELRLRWPDVAGVAYHLAFAELAAGDPARALAVLRDARDVLPQDRRLLPEALAEFHTGATEPLRDRLESLLDGTSESTPPRQVHELHRMLASLAILTGDRDAAAHHLLEDLDWLRHHASLLHGLAQDVASAGEVLVELGHADALAVRIEAMQPLAASVPQLGHALTYVAGLVLVRQTETAPAAALATLDRNQRTVWSTLLRAAAHRQRGEIVDETRELATAVRISDAALVRADLSRALRALGRNDEANQLRIELRQRLLAIDLRRPLDHPLLDPARALAFVSTE